MWVNMEGLLDENKLRNKPGLAHIEDNDKLGNILVSRIRFQVSL